MDSRRILKIDVNQDYIMLMTGECQAEINTNSDDPSELLSPKCSAEVRMLDANPEFVQDAKDTITSCNIADIHDAKAVKKCLDMILKDRRKVINKAIAAKQIGTICDQSYGSNADAANSCKVFGGMFVDHEGIDFSQTHGYDAAQYFQLGIEALKKVVSEYPSAGAVDTDKLFINMARNLYGLGIQYQDSGVEKMKGFVDTIGFVVEKVRHSANNITDETSEKKGPIVTDAHKKEAPKLTKNEPAGVPVAVETKKTVEPEKNEARRAKENRLIKLSTKLMYEHFKVGHPLVKALEVVVPPATWLMLSDIVAAKIEDIVKDANDTTLNGLTPSKLFAIAIQSVSHATNESLTDAAARSLCNGMGIDFDSIEQLGYSGGRFIYAGMYYDFEELPPNVQPLADLMVDVANWQPLRSNPMLQRSMTCAYEWIDASKDLASLGSDMAGQYAHSVGLCDIDVAKKGTIDVYTDHGIKTE